MPAPSPGEAVPTERRLRGVAAVFLAGAVWSMGGLFFRLLDSDKVWPVLAWRFLAVMVFFAAVHFLWRRGAFWSSIRQQGAAVYLGGTLVAFASIFFVFSLDYTTVFNALMMLSLQPLLAACLGWVFLREPVRPVTWLAIAIAVLGVGIMVGGSLDGGGWIGNLLAFGSSVSFAAYSVMTRATPPADSTIYTMMGGAIGAAIAFGVSLGQGASLLLAPQDYLLCLAMGWWQLGLGFLLFNWGSRQIPAAEAVLVAQSEVVLGPLWVWLVVGEVPSEAALIGGAVLLAAVILQALLRRGGPPQVDWSQ